MATGYTYIIEQRDVTFAEFALRCARAFGATITMRDLSLDAAIPERFDMEPYHTERLASALARVRELEAMDEVSVRRHAHESNVKHIIDVLISNAKAAVLKAKYQTLLNQAATWAPPTPDHVSLRQFMVEQLTESMEWDCSPREWPSMQTPEEWYADELSNAKRETERALEELAKEEQRLASRNDWIAQLRASLVALCDARGVSADWILGRTDNDHSIQGRVSLE